MASAQREQVRRFIQILWVPKEQDRIVMRRDGKLKRGVVEGHVIGTYFQSIEPGKATLSREMFFVPRKADYMGFLNQLVFDGVIGLSSADQPGEYQLVRRFKKWGQQKESMLTAVGSPQTIIYVLLNSRLNDIALNQYINEQVLRRREEESVGATIIPFPV